MAHYALINEENIVTQVIVGVEPNELIDGLYPEEYYENMFNQKCLLTSHTGSIRKNFASAGMIYNKDLDAFIGMKHHESWILNEETCLYEPPVPKPEWGIPVYWNEEDLRWEIEPYKKNTVTIESRVLTCLECPFYDKVNTMCNQCGCHAKHLHTDINAVCPENKW